MRGFFGGVIVGFVILTAGAAVLSLLTPLSQRPDVASRAPVEVNETSQPAEDSGVGPVGKDADLVEAAPTAPGSAAPGADDLAPLDSADTEPADKPEVGGATGGLATEPGTPAAPEIAAGTDSPVTPQAQTDGPSAPASDASASISTDPAQPAPPVVSDAGSGFGAPQVDETAPEVGTGSAADSSPDSDGVSMAQPGDGAASGAGPQVSTDPGRAPEAGTETGPAATAPRSADDTGGDIATAGTAPAPEVSGVPQQPTGDTGPETVPDAAPDPEPASPPRVAALPQVNSAPDASEPRTRPGTPVVPLTERGNGDAPASDAAPPEGPAATAADSDEPRLKRFAVPFEAPEGKPLMSILLIDTEGSIGAEALREFPYPLSFAVDPADPKAAEKMAQYRDAGFEVTLLADLPPAATAQDAEVSMAVWLETLSEAIAIVEGTGPGIQGNRGLSDQVTAIAGSEGLGLVTQSNGLNTVQKLAERAGVPSAVVFRDFDGAGQTPTVMRRFLDQAAFRAGQEGAVIMLGRVQPDTISALLLWGLQDRAQRVALSPLSTVLLREEAAQ